MCNGVHLVCACMLQQVIPAVSVEWCTLPSWACLLTVQLLVWGLSYMYSHCQHICIHTVSDVMSVAKAVLQTLKPGIELQAAIHHLD